LRRKRKHQDTLHLIILEKNKLLSDPTAGRSICFAGLGLQFIVVVPRHYSNCDLRIQRPTACVLNLAKRRNEYALRATIDRVHCEE
jgi:hypothetical protein